MLFEAPEGSTIWHAKCSLNRHPLGIRAREDDLKICGVNKRVRPVGEVSLCFCFFRQFDENNIKLEMTRKKVFGKTRRCPRASSDSLCAERGQNRHFMLLAHPPKRRELGLALYKLTPWGARAHFPHASAPSPLPFVYSCSPTSSRDAFLFSGATKSSEEMASRDRACFPPTKVLRKSYMTQGMIEDLEKRGVLEAGMARPPPDGEIEAKPHSDEVVVFHDFFIAGLRFPLDPVVVEIFKLFDVYTLYMWLTKTHKLKPTATGFARLFRCHFQPKTVFVKPSEEAEASEAEPQFGVYTFAFHTNVLSPVVAYRNRWGA